MTPINIKAIAPADLLPLPDVPESYGSRNAEEQRIYARVKTALEGPGTRYSTVEHVMRKLRASLSH